MKLYRYMSFEEFIKMSSGMDMIPFREEFIADTSSKGFCFLGEKTEFDTGIEDVGVESYTPIQCESFLDGVANTSILVEFETTDEITIEEGYGRYANPYFGSPIQIKEYSTMKYNKEILKPVRFYSELLNKDWIQYNESDILNYREYLNCALSKETQKLECKNLMYLPPIPGTDENEAWSYNFETKAGGGVKKSIKYGSILSEKKRYEISFSRKSWNEPYVLDSNENIPEFWKNIYENPLQFSNDADLESFFIYLALKADYPKQMKAFKLEKDKGTGRIELKSENPEFPFLFDLKDGIIVKNEDGTIEFGFEEKYEYQTGKTSADKRFIKMSDIASILDINSELEEGSITSEELAKFRGFYTKCTAAQRQTAMDEIMALAQLLGEQETQENEK